MRQKKAAITPQKYPSYNGIWNALLYRKYFEHQLLKHAGLPIRRSTFKYGRFRSVTENFLPGEIVNPSPSRDLTLALPVITLFIGLPRIILHHVNVNDYTVEKLAHTEIVDFLASIVVGAL